MSQPAPHPISSPEPEIETTETRPAHEQIAALAYALWEARGCPEGSPEEDWFRAEQELAANPE